MPSGFHRREQRSDMSDHSRVMAIIMSAPRTVRDAAAEAIVHADPEQDGSLMAEIDARGAGDGFREIMDRLNSEIARRRGRSRFVTGWRPGET